MSKLFELTFKIDQFRGWVLTLLVLPVLGKVLEEGGSSSRCSMSCDSADGQIARHSFDCGSARTFASRLANSVAGENEVLPFESGSFEWNQ